MTLGQAADLVNVSIQKVWLKDNPDVGSFYDKMFNVVTGVTDLYMKDSSLSGLGSASRVVENATLHAEVPVQGFDQTFTQVLYGKVLSFTWQMWKFGIKKRDLTRIVNALKMACMTRREELAAEKYDAAFVTSYSAADDMGNYTITTSGGDGVAMASASHTREDGGTAWSNIVNDGTTANLNADYPALKAMRRIGALVKTPKGKPMPMKYDRIIAKDGTDAFFRLKEVQGALKAGKIPGEFSNDGAAVENFELLANPYLQGIGNASSPSSLSSATNFHGINTGLLGDEYGPQYYESQPISLDEQNIVYKTKEIQQSAIMCFAMGHNDPRSNISSTGARV